MFPDLVLGVVIVVASVASAMLSLFAVALLSPNGQGAEIAAPSQHNTVFLFDGEGLVDAVGPASDLLSGSEADHWDALIHKLVPHFADLPNALKMRNPDGRMVLDSAGPRRFRLTVEQIGRLTRLEIEDVDLLGMPLAQALGADTDLLRHIAASLPVLVWRQDYSGTIDWANRAYLNHLSLRLGVRGGEVAWPFPALFIDMPNLKPGDVIRQTAANEGTSRSSWYERSMCRTAEGELHFAIPADNVVRAEQALREFVQTLTKTFAQLQTGLAIFDRHRQLALFNPALTELTSLAPEFLSSRPTLVSFFDALRDARMIPEPKNYQTWRQAMTGIEQAAERGVFEETWSLAAGQTYRVTGRPHPDGAVAFLFEDISAEVSLSRRFRTEIELSHEVLNHIPDAVAVFSTAGALLVSNAAFAALWGIDPATSLSTISASDCLRDWAAMADGKDGVNDIAAFLTGSREAPAMTTGLRLRDGRRLRCRMVELAGGAVMASFDPAAIGVFPTRKLRQRLRVTDPT